MYVLNILNMLCILRFFFLSSKCSLFHNANFFGSCIIHILYTGCAEIKKKFRRQRVNIHEFGVTVGNLVRLLRGSNNKIPSPLTQSSV